MNIWYYTKRILVYGSILIVLFDAMTHEDMLLGRIAFVCGLVVLMFLIFEIGRADYEAERAARAEEEAARAEELATRTASLYRSVLQQRASDLLDRVAETNDIAPLAHATLQDEALRECVEAEWSRRLSLLGQEQFAQYVKTVTTALEKQPEKEPEKQVERQIERPIERPMDHGA